MTTVNIQLPDDLARQVEGAGLLDPKVVEEIFRDELRKQSFATLMAISDRIIATNDLPYMSPEEVADDIRAMRAERRVAVGE
jgi:hypothetical protein